MFRFATIVLLLSLGLLTNTTAFKSIQLSKAALKQKYITERIEGNNRDLRTRSIALNAGNLEEEFTQKQVSLP